MRKRSERLVGESFGDDAANSIPSKSSAPPSSAAVASGLSVNRQPGTDRLRGRSFEITLETDEEVVLEFLADGTLQWNSLPGHALDRSGTCPVDVVEAAPDVLLIVAMLPPQGRETMATRSRPRLSSRALRRLDAGRGLQAIRAEDPRIAAFYPRHSSRLAKPVRRLAANADPRSHRHPRALSL